MFIHKVVFFACNLGRKPYIPFATQVLHCTVKVLHMLVHCNISGLKSDGMFWVMGVKNKLSRE